MLKGDLTSTPLAPLLLDLADEAATGCLTITDFMGDEATVYLKSGSIYAVSVPGNRPQLGAKLVSSGSLPPDALAEALNAQRTELQGWRLGELLVHLGYVEQPVVEAFVKEQVCEAMWDLLRWPHGEWKFRKNIKTREDVGPPIMVRELLEILRDRGYQWESISAVIHGPAAVPTLSARSHPNPKTTLDSDAWSMLCKIDGERTVAELAHDCGYTMFEAGHIILSLVRTGLVDIAEELDGDDDIDDGERPYGASALSLALAGEFDDASEGMTKLARLADEVTSESSSPATNGDAPDSGPTAPAKRRNTSRRLRISAYTDDSFAESLAKVSNALSDVLGRDAPPIGPAVSHVVQRPTPAIDDADLQRRKRARAAAAEEMATAQALIESLRDPDPPSPSPEPIPEVQPDAKGGPDEGQIEDPPAEQDARQTEEAARLAAEQFARAAAEEAERVAAEQEAQRRAAVQAAAEDAERAAAEQEARRIAAEAAVRERAEAEQREAAEQAAAEEAARLAAEAEAAAAEAERLRSEREAAERAAWEEHQARQAAEEAERSRLEAERIAAEQAEHVRLEAERIAAEEAERQAAAQSEAARLAAEQQAEAEAEAQAAREAEHHAEEAAAAKALLVELASETPEAQPTAAESTDAEEPAPDDASDVDAGYDATDELADVDASGPWAGSDTADTAALLRELSSLGGDEERAKPSAPSQHRAPRPGSEKKPKKKIGLFGL